MMIETFAYDVFLSHSSKDASVARTVAKRLRTDGIRVWLDEWIIKPGDSIQGKIEEGLESFRVLVLLMSANAFASDWAQMESYTFRFRDPLNKERRLIPLRIDTTPIKGSLAQFSYVNWSPKYRKNEYLKLLDACRPIAQPSPSEVEDQRFLNREFTLNDPGAVKAYSFSHNEKFVLTGSNDNRVRLWDMATGGLLRVFSGHSGSVWSVAWSSDGRHFA